MQSHFVFQHNFNLYDMMLLMTAALAVLLAVPLLMKRDRDASDLLLAAFVISQGFYSFHNVMLFSETLGPTTIELFYPFHALPRTLILGGQGLLLLWYARAMMGNQSATRTRLTWLGIGLTVMGVAVNLSVTTTLSSHKHLIVGCDWLLQLFAVALGVYTLQQLRAYQRALPLTYSNVDRHSLRWLWIAALGFVSVWSLHLLAMLVGIFGSKPLAIGIATFSNLPPLILIGAMVVYGQTHAISRPLSQTKRHRDEDTDDIAYTVNPELPYRLDDLMLRVKVYQDPELRLEGLADSMNISPRSLSTLLNRHYKKHFYDFVNDYRVLDAQEQLSSADNTDKPIQRVFEDAGFNSKTTFNTLFKKHTGLTPSEFRRRANQLHTHAS